MDSERLSARETNSLQGLREHGQSVWCDTISREFLVSGDLLRLITEDGLGGVTSNPTIFEKAINDSTNYDKEIHALGRSGQGAKEIYESLAIKDIQRAAAILEDLFESTEGADGYVSLEVSPHLAHQTQETIEEARRLWQVVARPNVMIKVPATPAGIPAISKLIGEGININVTLMFSMEHYVQVAEAYLRGLETLAEMDPRPPVASVASFFVSRVDTLVDRLLEEKEQLSKTRETRETCHSLLGRTAIANAQLVYQEFKEVFSGNRFLLLKQKGYRVQRPLWASTSVKNPLYRDVLYIEELVGPDTVNTMPLSTLSAFRDHGIVKTRLEDGLEDARQTFRLLKQLGIDMDAVTVKLQEDGVKLFVDSFDALLASIETKKQASLRT